MTSTAPARAPHGSRPGERPLLPGRLVEVRPLPEILATLDENQALDGLPFMPEMEPFCGKRFRVALRAERTCINPPEVPFRRLRDAVVLEDLRCDGSLHGRCQLGCMFLWKEAWLRRPGAGGRPGIPSGPAEAAVLRATDPADPDRYICQATELPRATEPGEPIWKPGQYLRFLAVRTLTLPELLVMYGRPVVRRARWLASSLVSRRPASSAAIPTRLGLQPGEWVEVRSRDEILRTLDEEGRTRGLAFSTDMYRLSGHRMRVKERIERVVIEQTGRLRAVHDTVILEDSICDRYRGCARGMPILWREAWLKRIETAPADVASGLRAAEDVTGG